MAVVIETTIGDFTIDLFVNSRPQACKNFLKLCKMKYYNFCLFHSVQHNFLAQTGDPSGVGSGGESIYGLLHGENARYFETEVMPKIKHNKPGLLSMVNCGNNMLGSQFFITLGEESLSLDGGEHCVFGEIGEGIEIIHKLNEAICDNQHRPYKDIRITHTVILEDPFEDPSGLIVPDMSPEATKERLANGRIGADEEIDDTAGLTVAEVEELRQEREAKARATILEIVGDLPDADVAPPENVLFVCKLNPITTDEDLEIIFNRFGKVKSCEIIRDKTTGDSLQYAFVEFHDQKSCEEAYFKMDNVLIDDRRIHVDFSQSTAKERKIRWKGKGKGVENLDQEESNDIKANKLRDRGDSRSWSSNRRDRSYEDRDRRRERGREKDDDRQSKEEKGKEKDSDDKTRRRRDRDRSRSEDSECKGKEKNSEDRRRRRRDRSRSAYRKRDSQHKRDNHWEDDKRFESKRRENRSSRKKEEDTKAISSSYSSKRVDDKSLISKRIEDRKSDEWKKEMEKRDPNGKSNSISSDLVKKKSTEIETKQLYEKSSNREQVNLKPSNPVTDKSKGNKLIESHNISKECFVVNETKEDSSCPMPVADLKENVPSTLQISSTDTKIVIEETVLKEELEGDNSSDRTLTVKSNDKTEIKNQISHKKRTLKTKKNHLSETRKRKKRYYSSSSDSSSESTDSSESSSSSDSSDYRHSKKKKLIIAKRYYRGGKLIKEIKKKKRTQETSDSESISNESSDRDSRKKHKQKRNKKRQSDDSLSESSSDDSDGTKYKKKKRKNEKYAKKKSKYSSPKKKKKRKESSGSSDSEYSIKSKTNLIKKTKRNPQTLNRQ